MVVTSKLFNVSTIVRASILGAIGLMDGDRLKPNCSAAVLLPLVLFMMLSCMRLSQQCSHPTLTPCDQSAALSTRRLIKSS